MKEAEKNDLFDSEAEESGSELEERDSVHSDTEFVVPEGIDITERPCIFFCVFIQIIVTEREQLDVIHLHNQIKEQTDEQQLEYVRKGVREGTRYMHRSLYSLSSLSGQMQRNQVPYDAFADDDEYDGRKKTRIAALSDGEDSDEPNEEEEYLKQIRKERFLRDVLGETPPNRSESDEVSSESDAETPQSGEKDGFSKEEKKEMEEFVQRVERERRPQRGFASRSSFRGSFELFVAWKTSFRSIIRRFQLSFSPLRRSRRPPPPRCRSPRSLGATPLRSTRGM